MFQGITRLTLDDDLDSTFGIARQRIKSILDFLHAEIMRDYLGEVHGSGFQQSHCCREAIERGEKNDYDDEPCAG